MKNSGKRAVAVLTAIAMFALSGLALAAEGDNTVVNFGYDQNSQFFMWNVTSLDHEPYDEGSEEGAESDLDALLEACGLENTEEATSYGFTFDGETIRLFELDDEGNFDPEGEPVELGDCGTLTGGFVTGPAGQVNHGMFMKLFNSMYDGPNRGCLVRLIARSDLGKGDHKVKPGVDDGDGSDEPTLTVEDGNMTFTTLTTECQGKGARDGEDDAESDSDTGRRGPPQHVLDKFGGEKPGKSGSAGNRP